MAKDAATNKLWKRGPDAYDYPAATAYLSLLFPAGAVDGVIASLRAAGEGAYAAKHLLRAAQLPLLPRDDVEVKKALTRLKTGRKLAPVLLVRGDGNEGAPLIVADGYQRICACYHLGEDTPVAGRMANRPSVPSDEPPEAPIPTNGSRVVTAGRVAGTLIGTALLLLCVLGARRLTHRRR